jgi:hypothetical protein
LAAGPAIRPANRIPRGPRPDVGPTGRPSSPPRRLVPDWLHRTLHPAYRSLPWHDVVRSGLALPMPLGIGIAVHQLPAGLFGTLGALLGVLAERSGMQLLVQMSIAATRHPRHQTMSTPWSWRSPA